MFFRILQYECDQQNCPLGKQNCSNRAFQTLTKELQRGKLYDTGFEVVWLGLRGYGLKSTRPYAPGELIIEYCGDVISPVEIQRRIEKYYLDSKNHYFLSLENGCVIDSGRRGSAARFANHSCNPNSEMQKWYVHGIPRIGLFASESIPAGTELTYDYNFDWFDGAKMQVCLCGAPNCRGYIGKRSSSSRRPTPDDVYNDTFQNLKSFAKEKKRAGSKKRSRALSSSKQKHYVVSSDSRKHTKVPVSSSSKSESSNTLTQNSNDHKNSTSQPSKSQKLVLRLKNSRNITSDTNSDSESNASTEVPLPRARLRGRPRSQKNRKDKVDDNDTDTPLPKEYRKKGANSVLEELEEQTNNGIEQETLDHSEEDELVAVISISRSSRKHSLSTKHSRKRRKVLSAGSEDENDLSAPASTKKDVQSTTDLVVGGRNLRSRQSSSSITKSNPEKPAQAEPETTSRSEFQKSSDSEANASSAASSKPSSTSTLSKPSGGSTNLKPATIKSLSKQSTVGVTTTTEPIVSASTRTLRQYPPIAKAPGLSLIAPAPRTPSASTTLASSSGSNSSSSLTSGASATSGSSLASSYGTPGVAIPIRLKKIALAPKPSHLLKQMNLKKRLNTKPVVVPIAPKPASKTFKEQQVPKLGKEWPNQEKVSGEKENESEKEDKDDGKEQTNKKSQEKESNTLLDRASVEKQDTVGTVTRSKAAILNSEQGNRMVIESDKNEPPSIEKGGFERRRSARINMSQPSSSSSSSATQYVQNEQLDDCSSQNDHEEPPAFNHPRYESPRSSQYQQSGSQYQKRLDHFDPSNRTPQQSHTISLANASRPDNATSVHPGVLLPEEQQQPPNMAQQSHGFNFQPARNVPVNNTPNGPEVYHDSRRYHNPEAYRDSERYHTHDAHRDSKAYRGPNPYSRSEQYRPSEPPYHPSEQYYPSSSAQPERRKSLVFDVTDPTKYHLSRQPNNFDNSWRRDFHGRSERGLPEQRGYDQERAQHEQRSYEHQQQSLHASANRRSSIPSALNSIELPIPPFLSRMGTKNLSQASRLPVQQVHQMHQGPQAHHPGPPPQHGQGHHGHQAHQVHRQPQFEHNLPQPSAYHNIPPPPPPISLQQPQLQPPFRVSSNKAPNFQTALPTPPDSLPSVSCREPQVSVNAGQRSGVHSIQRGSSMQNLPYSHPVYVKHSPRSCSETTNPSQHCVSPSSPNQGMVEPARPSFENRDAKEVVEPIETSKNLTLSQYPSQMAANKSRLSISSLTLPEEEQRQEPSQQLAHSEPSQASQSSQDHQPSRELAPESFSKSGSVSESRKSRRGRPALASRTVIVNSGNQTGQKLGNKVVEPVPVSGSGTDSRPGPKAGPESGAAGGVTSRVSNRATTNVVTSGAITGAASVNSNVGVKPKRGRPKTGSAPGRKLPVQKAGLQDQDGSFEKRPETGDGENRNEQDATRTAELKAVPGDSRQSGPKPILRPSFKPVPRSVIKTLATSLSSSSNVSSAVKPRRGRPPNSGPAQRLTLAPLASRPLLAAKPASDPTSAESFINKSNFGASSQKPNQAHHGSSSHYTAQSSKQQVLQPSTLKALKPSVSNILKTPSPPLSTASSSSLSELLSASASAAAAAAAANRSAAASSLTPRRRGRPRSKGVNKNVGPRPLANILPSPVTSSWSNGNNVGNPNENKSGDGPRRQ